MMSSLLFIVPFVCLFCYLCFILPIVIQECICTLTVLDTNALLYSPRTRYNIEYDSIAKLFRDADGDLLLNYFLQC